MPEGIGDVADRHACPESFAHPAALKQVADQGFRADQEFVRQDIPGTDQNTPFLDIAAQVAGTLAGLARGQVAGRGSDDEITLFKSVGLAIQDVAAASFVYQRALAARVGVAFEF